MKTEEPISNVLIIHDFYSPEECEQELEYVNKIGFVEQHYGVRKEEARRRASNDDVARAKQIYSKISIPPLEEFYKDLRPDPYENVKHWEPIGLNRRLRYYQYEFGQRFSEHIDLMFRLNDYTRTFLTFIVYLNEDFEGGETRFGKDFIKPRKGSVIIFPHELKHEGMTVIKGCKTVLRSDIIYKNLQG